ncbi:MAG TPA: hypothetical protein VH475_24150 [Tepidisphaeraceae bacterium]
MAPSDPWHPEPDPGPSPDHNGAYRAAPYHTRVTLEAEGPSSAPEWLRSPWTWASVGGVAVAIVFSVVFIVNRPGPAIAAARTSSPKRQAAAPPEPFPDATQAPVTRTVDLMPLIDPSRDAVGGNWHFENGELASDASHRAKLAIRYAPPKEYDFRVQFTQVDGDNCVVQMFTHRNPCALILGGWKRTCSGFQQIANQSANNNPTGIRNLSFENGKRHTSVVRVRRNSIEAWLDGTLLTSYATDGTDLANRDWEITPCFLGVGSEVSATVFHKIELVEINTPAATGAR